MRAVYLFHHIHIIVSQTIFRIKATRYAWRAESEDKSKVSGYMKEYKGLMFLKLLNAGHMVPMDLPRQSLDMMSTFLYGKSFEESAQNIKPQNKDESCPICPSTTCDPSSPCGDCSSETGQSASASYRLSRDKVPWVVACITTLALVFVLMRSRRRRGDHRELVSEYDLELREGSYSDNKQMILE
jgi:hypothetical protein